MLEDELDLNAQAEAEKIRLARDEPRAAKLREKGDICSYQGCSGIVVSRCWSRQCTSLFAVCHTALSLKITVFII